jgi:hypothetical protein
MQDILAESLKRLKQTRVRRMRVAVILLVLSLVVSLDVFWVLRQPGLTLAGDADCGITEHTHDEICQNGETTCNLPEHVHTIDCYCDETADVETQLDWQKLFADYPFTGDLRQDLVGIAKTQVGYTESRKNFEADGDGARRGYTRYGAWYGAPYNDWSAMFVSFCLHYAGAAPDEYPGNTGANAMAEQWKQLGKYTPAGRYVPVAGDLVFFEGNRVGVVAEVHSTTVYVIQGDVDDAVQGSFISAKDPSISGWGKISAPAAITLQSSAAMQQMQTVIPKTDSTVTDLIKYLNDNKGDYYFTLLDINNHEVPKDINGNFVVHADTQYKITLTCNSPNGFSPGTYQYQFPGGVEFGEGSGNFILSDTTNVGIWEISEDGLILLTFNDHINNRTEVTISATTGISFPKQADPIDFDGKITVTVEKPQEEIHQTEVNKWGVQGNPDNAQDPSNGHKTDPKKIYWTVKVEGNKNSSIPGSTLSDRILLHEWSYEHRYTEADRTAGLSFGVSAIDPDTSKELFWHRWTVLPGDPNLTWDENGWTYNIPETITCRICGEEILLGNEYWTYFVEYSSTPTQTDVAGVLDYSNIVEIDHQTKEGWAGFIQNEVKSAIFKTGTFVSDAGGGKFLWELKATIQGRKPNEKAKIDWYILDTTSISDEWGTLIKKIRNDMQLVSVTANYYGQTIQVPLLKDATEDDPYALLYNEWGSDGTVVDTQQYKILCRCECTVDNCHRGTGCWTYGYIDNDGRWHDSSDFCECWLETEDTTFTFVYETTNADVIAAYSGSGYFLRNVALLMNTAGDNIATDAKVPIPNILEKELLQEFDPLKGSIAKYQITVNESKLVLTDGSPLVIHDVMTDSLAFISGSLQITTEDAAGNIATLQQGTDFTATYDGTGTKKDENGKPVHTLDIVIQHPQPVTYTLTYDTTLIYPEQVSGGIKYSNSASITLWGQKIKGNSVGKVYADINIAAKSYKIDLYKTGLETGDPLPGAVFGLYNAQGGLITSATTNNSGYLYFQTNIVKGIILREHELYYVQELQAPSGYKLDEAKHWFCFCDKKTDYCDTCSTLIAGRNALRIPFEQVGQFRVSNQVATYQLPATGGTGIYPLILVSVSFIITPLVYMSVRRRKRERRGAP